MQLSIFKRISIVVIRYVNMLKTTTYMYPYTYIYVSVYVSVVRRCDKKYLVSRIGTKWSSNSDIYPYFQFWQFWHLPLGNYIAVSSLQNVLEFLSDKIPCLFSIVNIYDWLHFAWSVKRKEGRLIRNDPAICNHTFTNLFLKYIFLFI